MGGGGGDEKCGKVGGVRRKWGIVEKWGKLKNGGCKNKALGV